VHLAYLISKLNNNFSDDDFIGAGLGGIGYIGLIGRTKRQFYIANLSEVDFKLKFKINK